MARRPLILLLVVVVAVVGVVVVVVVVAQTERPPYPYPPGQEQAGGVRVSSERPMQAMPTLDSI